MYSDRVDEMISNMLSQVIESVLKNDDSQPKEGESYDRHVERLSGIVFEEFKKRGRPFPIPSLDKSIAKKVADSFAAVNETVVEEVPPRFDRAAEVVKQAIGPLTLSLSILDDEDRELVADDLARRHIESAFGKLICPCCFGKISDEDKFFMLDAVKAGVGIESGKAGLVRLKVERDGAFFNIAVNGLVSPYVSEIEIMGIFTKLEDEIDALMDGEMPNDMREHIQNVLQKIINSKK